MARFLLTLWPYPTHLRPFLAVAHGLRRRGHEVAFYIGGDGAATVKEEGFEIFPYARTDWSGVQQAVDRLIANRRHIHRLGALWKNFLVDTAPAQIEDIESILAAWPADVIVCDLAMCGPYLVIRERRGIPVAMLSHVASCLIPGPEGPLAGNLLARGGGGMRRLTARLIGAAVESALGAVALAAAQLRRRYGLPKLSTTLTAFAGQMDLYLQLGAPEFDYSRRDLPPSVHYIGACLWVKAAAHPPPAWLESIPRGRPWVLVEEGALYTREAPLLEAAVNGLARLPYEVIVLRGEARPPGTLAIPAKATNVHVQDWAPLSDLLPHVEAVVTNANSDSVLLALDQGKPLVAVPSIWDQLETARQISTAGVGVHVSVHRCTPDRLVAEVRRVLADPAYKRCAEQIGADLRKKGGSVRAAQLLESLTSPPPK